MPNPKDFDLNFRPKTYWGTTADGFANIKGEMRRRMVENAITKNEFDNIPASAFSDDLSLDERKLIGFIDPKCMGGEYLPPYQSDEIEIVRVSLASTTWDVIPILARMDNNGLIHYRIVDEYMKDGKSNYSCNPENSRKPLPLGAVINLLDNAEWKAGSCLGYKGLTGAFRDYNYDSIWPGKNILEGLVNFVRVSSYFYPELERWYETEAAEWFASRLAELDLEDM